MNAADTLSERFMVSDVKLSESKCIEATADVAFRFPPLRRETKGTTGVSLRGSTFKDIPLPRRVIIN